MVKTIKYTKSSFQCPDLSSVHEQKANLNTKERKSRGTTLQSTGRVKSENTAVRSTEKAENTVQRGE